MFFSLTYCHGTHVKTTSSIGKIVSSIGIEMSHYLPSTFVKWSNIGLERVKWATHVGKYSWIDK